ncbi:MAG TPA: YIP1 family protein [Candidatus Paceibacterota bacterium]
MAQFHFPHIPQFAGWDALTRSHMSVLKMFFLYAVPLSLLPPVMIHYAGVTYGGHALPMLTELQLQTIGIVFFIAELAMTFLVAYAIQRMGEVIDIKPAFEDAYKLAIVVPTPLWLAPLFLFIPSVIINITIAAAALILSGMLIFYGVPAILKVHERGHAMLLSGSILAAGMVAWAAMMYLTLLSWSFVTSSLLLLI